MSRAASRAARMPIALMVRVADIEVKALRLPR
jgi:hypothetical protein